MCKKVNIQVIVYDPKTLEEINGECHWETTQTQRKSLMLLSLLLEFIVVVNSLYVSYFYVTFPTKSELVDCVTVYFTSFSCFRSSRCFGGGFYCCCL